jgi:hypothetical protein
MLKTDSYFKKYLLGILKARGKAIDGRLEMQEVIKSTEIGKCVVQYK